MMLAGWVGAKSYSNKTYYYSLVDRDPFAYAFNSGVSEVDSNRRKLSVIKALLRAENAPLVVREFAYAGRSPS
jgi:hypothetical protein